MMAQMSPHIDVTRLSRRSLFAWLGSSAVSTFRQLLQTATQASREAGSGSRVRFSDTEGWTQDFQS